MLVTAFLNLATAERVGSFMVLGDWGYAHWGLPGYGGCPGWACCESWKGCGMHPTCQQTIADKMKQWVKDNPDVKFVLNVGDSFYPTGVSSPTDERWDSSWKNVYGDTITNLKWYSVYGNHDYEGEDRCACGDPANDPSICAQLNGNPAMGGTHENLNGWYMPDLYYHDESYLSEFGIEIVAMDTNSVAESACKYLPRGCSRGSCWANLNARYTDSMNLFAARMKATQADNVLVFNHYPTNYFDRDGRESFLSALKTGAANDAQVYFFGGHVHFVKDGWGADISPAKQWLVGGGGGYGCDGPEQGFAVGIINKDENGKFSVEMQSQLVETSSCCYNKGSLKEETDIHAVLSPQSRVASADEAESHLKHVKETCGGLECESRKETLRTVRAQERLQGATDEASAVKEELADEADRESGLKFEFSQFFTDTMEEIRQAKAARNAAASARHQVEVE